MMSLYSLCLKTTISFEKIKIHDLPICIQNDLDKLKMYEHTLKEWNISLTLIDEINISIEKQRYAMEVLENQLLWGHALLKQADGKSMYHPTSQVLRPL